MEDFDARLAVCEAALEFVSCEKDADAATLCPDDKAAWTTRFAKVADKYYNFHQEANYQWLTAAYKLNKDEDAGRAAAYKSLTEFTAVHGLTLDADLAHYLAWLAPSNIPIDYAGNDVSAYVLGYASRSNYPYSASKLVSAAGNLRYYGHLGKQEFKSFLLTLLADENLTVRDRLTAERYAYNWGLLEKSR